MTTDPPAHDPQPIKYTRETGKNSAMEQTGHMSGDAGLGVGTAASGAALENKPARARRSPTAPLQEGRVGLTCPHCRSALVSRSSRLVTVLFKELRLQCVNVECSASYVASVTIDYHIAPSQMPNPNVRLRVGHRTSTSAPVAALPAPT